MKEQFMLILKHLSIPPNSSYFKIYAHMKEHRIISSFLNYPESTSNYQDIPYKYILFSTFFSIE